MFSYLVAVLAGCSQGPVFDGISEVILQTQGPAGIHDIPFEGDNLQKAIQCLATTQEIQDSQVDNDALIQEVLLLRVKDRVGDRMFEVTTTQNFSARGKFYRNDCMYRLIKQTEQQ